jgi:tetratricopeptide (TPR) repeat protein
LAAQDDGRPSKNLTQAKAYNVPIVSERRFLELVGKIAPEEQAKTYTTDELAALSKLPADVVEQLSMFGLIEVRDGRYGFRDLAAARQAAQLLSSRIGLSVITRSLREIRKWLPNARLSNLRLYPESRDRILVEQARGRTDIKGQFVLSVEKTNDLDANDAFARAQSAEEAGDLSTAESLYRRVMKLDPDDPAAGLNLGNLLRVQSRTVEAEAAYRWAVESDPNFHPAWHNLADLLEERRLDRAARRLFCPPC